MNKLVLPFLALALCSGTMVQAQFGGLLGGGKSSSDSKTDVAAVLDAGAKLMLFTTEASDLGMEGAHALLGAYPPEVVASLQALSDKVTAAKAKRTKDGDMDISEVEAVSAYEQSLADLDKHWNKYQKAGIADKVTKAHTWMNLMLAADATAVNKLPEYLTSAAGALTTIASNPMQVMKFRDLTAMTNTLTVTSKKLPGQILAIGRLEAICTKISVAEGFKLSKAPKVPSTDPVALRTLAAASDVQN